MGIPTGNLLLSSFLKWRKLGRSRLIGYFISAGLRGGQGIPMTMHKKNFAKPDEIMTPPHTRVERITIGDRTIVKQIFEPGWRWSKDISPLAGTKSCQIHHFGVQLTGKMHVKHDDGQEIEYEAGDVWDIPPGHDGWVVGDEAVVYYGFFQEAKK